MRMMSISGRASAACLLALLLACFGSTAAVAASLTVDFTTAEQFATCTRDAGIDTATVPGAAQLAPVEYFLDDVGNVIGSAGGGNLMGKKVFHLAQPEASGGTLYIFRNVAQAAFNGTPITFAKLPGTGNWYAAELPATLLKPGANEFVMGNCTVPVDTEQQPARRSFVSADRGATWKPAKGEFLAHLRLYRHPARGVMVSDVIDLANPTDADVICPRVTVADLALVPQATLPKGTAVELEARSGNTPRPDDTWSDWKAAKQVKSARFVQWRATLTTKHHAVTPVLEAVRITAEVTPQAGPAQTLAVKAIANPRIVRSSFGFTYQPPSENLRYLRENWKLDQVVAPGQTQREQFLLLRNWVRKQWPHNEGNCDRPWDAINILSAPAGDHGMCVHFGVTFTQCALALGFNARQVILNNHYVSEAWSDELQQWILMDVETVQPEGWDRYGTAIYQRKDTGRLMSGLDIHRALVKNELDKVTQLLTMTDAQGVFQNYERTYGPEQYGNFRYLAFPPRNNYLDELIPWEVAHGVDHYHSNGYYWWSDGPVADRAEYSVFSCREGDIYWTLNQAQVTLTETGQPGTLEVAVATETPNFAAFRYRLNDGAWQTLEAPGDHPVSRQARFTWTLGNGDNTLEIAPRNAFDRDGAVTQVVVTKG